MVCGDDPGFYKEKPSVFHPWILGDKLSFISVPVGMRATLYKDAGYRGESKTFDAGEWSLHSQNFADRASSIKISGTPVDGNASPTAGFVDQTRGGLGV